MIFSSPKLLSPHGPERRQILRVDEIAPEPVAALVVRRIFERFQNLNLAALMEDLRRDQTARGNWSFDRYLCPMSHGISSGHKVGLLCYLSQAVDLHRACRLAAEDLGVRPQEVVRFVESWDSGHMAPDWLLRHLQAIWVERLADADAVQSVYYPCSAPANAAAAQTLLAPLRLQGPPCDGDDAVCYWA